MGDPSDPALQGALFFYSLGAYPKLEQLSKKQLLVVIDELQEFCGMNPLARDEKGQMPQREIPHVGKMSLVRAYAWIGAILVARQYAVEGPEELIDKSKILAPCVQAYQLHRPALHRRMVVALRNRLRRMVLV